MRGRYPDKRETVESATVRLKTLLAGCTDIALSGFTVEHLAATHNVPVKMCEYELTMARQRRSAVPSHKEIQA